MKIDFDKVLNDLSGKPLVGEDADNGVSLKLICINALIIPYSDESGLSGEDKFARYKLAQKIHPGGEQTITSEEASLLKKLIGKGYGPLIVGQAYGLIEK